MERHVVPDHVESPARSASIISALRSAFPYAAVASAPEATVDELHHFHTPDLVERVAALCTESERLNTLVSIDMDTAVTPGSREAMLRAAGAVCHATRGGCGAAVMYVMYVFAACG
jgi:acetoin utilization deacetylase AcuC-like enzyme